MQIDEADSSTKAADQWWKLGYVAADDEPIKAEITTFEKVMEEACGVGSKPILIYASDRAMAEEPAPLSDALQVSSSFSECCPVGRTDKAPRPSFALTTASSRRSWSKRLPATRSAADLPRPRLRPSGLTALAV